MNHSLLRSSLSITYIHQSTAMGGAETFMADILEELQHQGNTIKVYSTHQPFIAFLKKKHISAAYIPIIVDVIGDWKGFVKTLFLLPKSLFVYHRIIKAECEKDLLIFSGFTEKIIGSWFANLYNIPVVWFEFGPMQSLFKKFFYVPKLLYFSSSFIPKKVIAPSHNTLRYLYQHTNFQKQQLALAFCGIKDMAPQVLRSIRKPQTNRIVCVSRLEPGKGQDLLIAAFKQVLQAVPSAQLSIIGEGGYLTHLKSLVNSLDLTSNVHFLGRVPNSLAEMAQSSVCVFPSMWNLEGFGLVVTEAMSLGKPVVAFNHGPGNELIENGVTGYVVESGNVNQLAISLINILKNKAMQKQLGRAGRKRYLKNYTITGAANRYRKIFLEVQRH